MSISTKKRTLDAFFKPPPKKARISEDGESPKSQEHNVEVQVSTGSNLVPISDQIRYYLVTPRTLFQYQTSQKPFQKSWLLCLPQLVEKSRTKPILTFSTLNLSSQSISNDKSSNSCVRNCLSTESSTKSNVEVLRRKFGRLGTFLRPRRPNSGPTQQQIHHCLWARRHVKVRWEWRDCWCKVGEASGKRQVLRQIPTSTDSKVSRRPSTFDWSCYGMQIQFLPCQLLCFGIRQHFIP